MVKTLYDTELVEVIQKIVGFFHPEEAPKYEIFLSSLGDAVAGYLDLIVGEPQPPSLEEVAEPNGLKPGSPNGEMGRKMHWSIPFRATEETPMTNNPLSEYDTDVDFYQWLQEIDEDDIV